MADTPGRTDRMVASVAHVFSWFRDGSWERHHLDPGVADFTFGNPQELPLPGLVDALQRNAVPGDKDWFAYKMSEEEPRGVVAESLRRRTGIAFEAEDVALTTGAFGALAVTIRALCDVGDEVIYLSPPWFFYELMIASAGATAVRVGPGRRHLRPRRRRHRRRDHPADAGDHRQHAAQPDRAHLPRARAARARRRAAGRVRAARPPDRPDLRRVVQPHRLRRHRLPDAGPRLRRDRDDLHLRQDDAGARTADRVRRRCTRRSRTSRPSATGSSSTSWAPAGASPTRCSSIRSATSRRCRSTSRRSRPAATGWSRRCARWATR